MPERLTLGQALAMIEDSQHPELERALANIDAAEAGQLEARALTGLNAKIVGQLRAIEPNDTVTDQSHDDHSLGLYLSKPLYDFGRTEAVTTAADAQYRANQSNYISTQNARRLEVMQRFFEVIVADHEFLRDNEDMASRYVRFDRARSRNELGQVSDVEVLRLETVYQEARLNRYRSESRQRASRARLAVALNRPNELPAELVRPELPYLEREVPEDIEALQQQARESNPAVRAARAQVEATQARVEAARAGDNPVLRAEAEAVTYSREIGARDDARIGVTLEVPLFSGGRNDAEVAKARAALRNARATLSAQEIAVQENILDTVLTIRNLRAQLEQAKVQRNWSELNLDLRRSEYEMERQATLGDAMIEIARAELFSVQTEFQLAVAWARLDALLGKAVLDTNSPGTAAAQAIPQPITNR